MRSTFETGHSHTVVLPPKELGSVEEGLHLANCGHRGVLLFGDVSVALGSSLLFLWLPPTAGEVKALPSWMALLTVLICPAASYIFDLYNIEKCIQPLREMLKRSLLSVLLVGVTLAALRLSMSIDPKALKAVVLQTVLLWIGIVLWREVYLLLSQMAIYKKPALILGAGDSGRALYELLKLPLSPYHIKGFVDDVSWPPSSPSNLPEVLGPCERLLQIVERTGAKDAILALPRDHDPEIMRSVLEARLKGTVIRDMVDVYEQLTGRIPIAHLEDRWLLFAHGFSILNRPLLKRTKRLLDIIVSGILLILALPLIALVCILIKLDSPGPVLYSQKRVGKDQKVFVLYKFRSMRPDAEVNGVQWASSNDPRVTGMGRILRRYRVDEIPQLFNVLRGDMGLVGPRPERPEFVQILETEIPYYFIRHAIKPGLTGWAQVTFRYGASLEDSLHKLEADLYYIKNMSFLLDIKILLRTIGVVFLAEGSR